MLVLFYVRISYILCPDLRFWDLIFFPKLPSSQESHKFRERWRLAAVFLGHIHLRQSLGHIMRGAKILKRHIAKFPAFFFFKFGQNPDENLLQPAVQKGS